MKAFLQEDIIQHLSPNGTTEIGLIPKGVGVERLRFDGTKLVDLATLNQIWVRKVNNAFELHAIEVPGAQLINMTYADRKKLKSTFGAISVKTPQDEAEESEASRKNLLLTKLRRALKNQVGPTDLRVEYAMAIIALLAEHAVNPTTATENAINAILPDLQAAYPRANLASRITNILQKLNTIMSAFWSKL